MWNILNKSFYNICWRTTQIVWTFPLLSRVYFHLWCIKLPRIYQAERFNSIFSRFILHKLPKWTPSSERYKTLIKLTIFTDTVVLSEVLHKHLKNFPFRCQSINILPFLPISLFVKSQAPKKKLESLLWQYT
jgi:hypothetical protein